MLTINVDSTTLPAQQPAYQGKRWQRSCSQRISQRLGL